MIKINDLKKQTFDDITMLLGEKWFDGHSPESFGLINVSIAEAVIFKAHTDGDVILNLGGRLATIPKDNYHYIEIF